MRWTAILVVSLALCVAAETGAKEGITLVGEGARTCRQFMDDMAADPMAAEDVYFAWAQGYLVGLNSRPDLFYDLKPGNFLFEEQRAHIRNFCARAERGDFMEAVRSLYQQIIIENIAAGR